MPDLGQLIGGIVGWIGGQLGASSLRLGPIPTITLFLVLLVLLSLVARPSTRWTVRDVGRLAAVPRAMALAAESGADAAFSLGTAGLARGVAAADRIQTLAALPILGHVARAAARGGVPLRVTSNDPVVVLLAQGILADAHEHTQTRERAERSDATYLGEGRPAAAAASLVDVASPAASFVVGGLGEEALLLLEGAGHGSQWSAFGSAQPSQAGSVLLTGGGTMIGPEPFHAPSDLGSAGRIGALAANRLILGAVVVLVLGSVAALVAGVDLAAPLAGR